ncbi:MAG: Mrp/NBP35 family ATP-binding protein [Leptospiraceae bacterium]|nr:Mrp/NBP35 family ATP-binding protein [Leptospiraceae bacterium]
MQQELKTLLTKVQNPLTHKNIIEDGTLEAIQENDDQITLVLSTPDDRRLQLALDSQIRTALAGSPALSKVKVKFNVKAPEVPKSEPSAPPANSIPGVDKIILIGSGKGGVGKSTVTLNLGISLKNMGYKVGLLDADIYGPSLGKMLGLSGRQNIDVQNDTIIPLEAYGLKVMSFSFLLDDNQPVVWRGPMLGKALHQFLYDIEWGKLDFLLIDLPPGTGDAHLSLTQMVQNDAAVVVTTPQNVALLDAGRAIAMFEQVNVPIAGVIENMSEFLCPHCGKGSHIFSKGGGSRLAASTKSVLLGQIPLTSELMEASDEGKPLATRKKNSPSAQKVVDAYEHAAQNLLSILAE